MSNEADAEDEKCHIDRKKGSITEEPITDEKFIAEEQLIAEGKVAEEIVHEKNIINEKYFVDAEGIIDEKYIIDAEGIIDGKYIVDAGGIADKKELIQKKGYAAKSSGIDEKFRDINQKNFIMDRKENMGAIDLYLTPNIEEIRRIFDNKAEQKGSQERELKPAIGMLIYGHRKNEDSVKVETRPKGKKTEIFESISEKGESNQDISAAIIESIRNFEKILIRNEQKMEQQGSNLTKSNKNIENKEKDIHKEKKE